MRTPTGTNPNGFWLTEKEKQKRYRDKQTRLARTSNMSMLEKLIKGTIGIICYVIFVFVVIGAFLYIVRVL